MTIGQLSSVNLIAIAGIQGNIGGVPIAANAQTTTNISNYQNLGVVSQYAAIKTSGALLSNTTKVTLNNLTSYTFPALTNAVPGNYIAQLGNTTTAGFTSVVTNEINTIMGFGDLGKFDQMLSLSDAYVISTNLLINSARNANDAVSNATYTSQDNTITGGISQISQAFSAFGDDLIALGNSINLTLLSDIGSPQALLRQIYDQTNGNAELNAALVDAGISQDTLNNLGQVTMTPEQQRIVFDVMTKITGASLAQLLTLLKVTTRGLVNLADLLNPVKAFPKSFNTLTAPTINGLRAIYINSSGAVNTNLETTLPPNVLAPLRGYSSRNTYSQLKIIIPPDWALANKALQAGFEQVTSIFNTNMTDLGIAVKQLESNKGLNLINSLTSPLPAAVTNYFSSTLSAGTGENGNWLLADLIGSAGGWNVSDNVSNATVILTAMTNSGALSTLTSGANGVFTVMQNALDGDYTVTDIGEFSTTYYVQIPAGLPGAGVYGNGSSNANAAIEIAFTGPANVGGPALIPTATTLINNIIANNAANVANANSAWNSIAAQIVLEQNSRSRANIVYADFPAGTQATSLITGLNSYGTETNVGGGAWFLESVANTSTLGGQAIISSLREARNQTRLLDSGVQTEIIVSEESVQPQISTSPGQYTVAEAAANKIV